MILYKSICSQSKFLPAHGRSSLAGSKGKTSISPFRVSPFTDREYMCRRKEERVRLSFREACSRVVCKVRCAIAER